MKKEDLIKNGKEVLAANKDMKEVYVTKDGQCFSTEHSAINHTYEVNGKHEINDGDEPIKLTQDDLKADTSPKVKPVSQYNKTELAAKADELGVVLVGKNNAENIAAIILAKEALKTKATELAIEFTDDTTDAELVELVAAKETETK